MNPNKTGIVYLVGAGPGDPGLLTLRGQACLALADVVVYDYLANPALLNMAPHEAERIYVGKKAGNHTLNQEDITTLIVEKALEGQVVVRLKGGDPFIFGRGGEEALELKERGIPFEIVPGVTSAVAVPAYAGIPLTHREHTSTVAFITGHEDPSKEKTDIAWDRLATGVGTLVFLMGVGNLAKISKSLISHGRAPHTPTAVIQRGTGPLQRTVVGELQHIARLAAEKGMRPPAVIVVGDVVELRKHLNWYETKPLFGKTIIVTRAREQASDFLEKLSQLGAECIQFPTIRLIGPESWDGMDRGLADLESYDWLLFTSVNGVRYFLERLKTHGKDVRAIKGIQIGAIGPKTADAWRRYGIEPDLVPDEYRAEAIVASMKASGIEGKKILLPRAAQARAVLPRELRKMGARVDVVEAYRTVKPKQDVKRVRDLLEKKRIHMVTFTSSSTVHNFVAMFEEESETLQQWMAHVRVACIGPITAATATEKGFSVDVVPDEYTIDRLLRRILAYYGAGGRHRSSG